MRVLVLESNNRIRQIYKKFFEQKNYQYDFVENSSECIDVFSQKFREDVFINYIILEQPSSTLEDKIRGFNPRQEILFLSPFMNIDNQEISKETRDLVEKPFAMVTLIGKIELNTVKPLITN